MARFREAKGRVDGNSGYARVFGSQGLGALFSRVQATVISAGTELERIVRDKVDNIQDLDDFLSVEQMPEGVFVVPKKQIKASKVLLSSGSEPDFLVFKRRQGRQSCHVIELKDGDAFDTKKSEAEHTALQSFVSSNARHLQYLVHCHVVSFNQDLRQAIYEGFKKRIPMKECMTGREFCELLEIDYDAIVEQRKADQNLNRKDFLTDLLKIKPVKKFLQKRLNEEV
ncbi:MAG: hypothetical protein OXO49_03975 [Gammaproteobacteria bacterium]|nr:hypothetical protein [Gammaproteobacteria bacterium]MDE0252143.1 hypothetical protein [Gammaproteobacteria bacterium]MDE0402748.1 hypothetical protein [Gammaproteobacteria bacterium]